MVTVSRVFRRVVSVLSAWAIMGLPTAGNAAGMAHIIPAIFTVTVAGSNYSVPTSISSSRGVLAGQLDVSSLAGQQDTCTILSGSTDKRGQLNMLCKEYLYGFTLGFAGTLGVKNGKGAGTYTGPISGTYTSSKQKQ